MKSKNRIIISQLYNNIKLKDKVQQLIVLTGFTISIVTILLITLGNNVFAIEYAKYTNNIYGIEFDYPKKIYLDSINPSFEQRDNYIIIPVGGNFKDSNQLKINSCAQSYHNKIPKIYRDDESYWEGSIVVCAYGLYNYNVNIGDKNLDPLLRIQIEGESEICMLDDHCMKKINQIIKGKIALQTQTLTPTLEGSRQSVPSPEILEYEKERKEAQKGTILEKLNEQPYTRQPYTTTDRDKKGFIDRDDDKEKENDESKPKVNLTTEEQELIKSCALYFYAIDLQPQNCKDLKPELKQQVQIEAEKRQEKFG